MKVLIHLNTPFSSQGNSSEPWSKYFLSVSSVQRAELGLVLTPLIPKPRPCYNGISGLVRELAPLGNWQVDKMLSTGEIVTMILLTCLHIFTHSCNKHLL